MQHHGVACNLLGGLGGTVDLHAAALRYPSALPGGVQPELTLTLQGLNPASIEMFMAIEYPEKGAPGFTPEGASSHTIGEFYSLLDEGLALAPPRLETERQVEGMGLSILSTAGDVHDALEIIKRQGVGSQYAQPITEHTTFLTIIDSRKWPWRAGIESTPRERPGIGRRRSTCRAEMVYGPRSAFRIRHPRRSKHGLAR